MNKRERGKREKKRRRKRERKKIIFSGQYSLIKVMAIADLLIRDKRENIRSDIRTIFYRYFDQFCAIDNFLNKDTKTLIILELQTY